ncbi:MAG: ACT domain-containing protein [Candidatus Dormibacteraeota bacterium]|nr:ACT domain-containing protein [Candidatus Dormibacteraeota bacterium]
MADRLQVLQVQLENRPGSLAAVADAVAAAGLNVEAVLAYTVGSESAAQIAVRDGGAARSALEAAGYVVVAERAALAVPIDDQPGALAALTRRLAAAGVNLNLVYLATGNRLLVAADDEEAARTILQ